MCLLVKQSLFILNLPTLMVFPLLPTGWRICFVWTSPDFGIGHLGVQKTISSRWTVAMRPRPETPIRQSAEPRGTEWKYTLLHWASLKKHKKMGVSKTHPLEDNTEVSRSQWFGQGFLYKQVGISLRQKWRLTAGPGRSAFLPAEKIRPCLTTRASKKSCED